MRPVSFGSVLCPLMVPVTVAIIPDAVSALILKIAVCELCLALPKSITPALGVKRVTQVAGHVLFVLPFDDVDGLPAAAAAVLKTVGEGRWIAFGQQLVMGRLTSGNSYNAPQHSPSRIHFDFLTS
jgi:hypothetical protein